jgi:hypothetical protein
VFTGGLGVYSIAFGFVTGWLYTRPVLDGAMAAADLRTQARSLIEAADDAESRGKPGVARELRGAGGRPARRRSRAPGGLRVSPADPHADPAGPTDGAAGRG